MPKGKNKLHMQITNDDLLTTAQKALATVTGAWLLEQMRDHHLTQATLCRELHIPQSTISEILNESGRTQNASARIKLYMEFRYRDAMRNIKNR